MIHSIAIRRRGNLCERHNGMGKGRCFFCIETCSADPPITTVSPPALSNKLHNTLWAIYYHEYPEIISIGFLALEFICYQLLNSRVERFVILDCLEYDENLKVLVVCTVKLWKLSTTVPYQRAATCKRLNHEARCLISTNWWTGVSSCTAITTYPATLSNSFA